MQRIEYNKKFGKCGPNERPKYFSFDKFKSPFVYTNEYNIKSIGDDMNKWLRIVENSDRNYLRDKKIYSNDSLF